MPWNDDDDDAEFEWVEEDQHEVPEDRGQPLSKIGPIAAGIFILLIVLFVLFLVGRALSAVRALGG